jgi:hypothetical protein
MPPKAKKQMTVEESQIRSSMDLEKKQFCGCGPGLNFFREQTE